MRKKIDGVVPASTSSDKDVFQSSMLTSLSNITESAAHTLRRFYAEQMAGYVMIAPFGQVPMGNILFLIGFVALGSFYGLLLRRSISKMSTKKSSKSARQNRTLGLSKSGSGVRSAPGYKEEVFEFMDTCADVRRSLRKVQDPDQARAQKFQQLKEHPRDGPGSDHDESSSHLVEMCLDVRKALHKVQDPDEARKLKLQQLKELELSRSAAEIAKQHQQAGLGRARKQ